VDLVGQDVVFEVILKHHDGIEGKGTADERTHGKFGWGGRKGRIIRRLATTLSAALQPSLMGAMWCEQRSGRE
jgi:hypothetical protein